MPSNYWIKLWIEILDDPKMGRLSDRLWRRAVETFLLAGDLNENGLLPALEDMAWRLRVDSEQLESDLIELQRVGITSQNNGAWFVINFEERQSSMTSTERTRRSRRRNKKKTRRETWRTRLWRPLPEDGGIYLLKIGPESYVGASVNVRRRVQQHFSEMKTKGDRFFPAFDKFGPDSISVDLLEDGLSSEELPEREQYWIDKITPTYNTEGAKRHRSWGASDKRERDESSQKRPGGVPEMSPDTDTESDTEADKDSSADDKRRRRPTKQDELKKELEKHFSSVSGNPVPPRKTKKQQKAAAVRWWNPLVEIADWFDGDMKATKEHIGATVAYMREEGLTVPAPQSILETARSKFGELHMHGGEYTHPDWRRE